MILYFDPQSESGCVGIFPGEGNTVVYTGTEVHTEPDKLREHPMALRLAEECDFHFWFREERPAPPFYTVPRTVAAGYDSRGGYFAAEDRISLNWSEPLYYIDSAFVCYRIVPAGQSLADMGTAWRETMVRCGDIAVFPDRAEAERHYPIRELKELMEELP